MKDNLQTYYNQLILNKASICILSFTLDQNGNSLTASHMTCKKNIFFSIRTQQLACSLPGICTGMCVALQAAGVTKFLLATLHLQASTTTSLIHRPSLCSACGQPPLVCQYSHTDLSSSFAPHHRKSSHISTSLGAGSFSHTQISPGAKHKP